MKKFAAFLLSLALLSVPPARAASSYPDLPSTHWAYSSMTRAAGLGLFTGSDDGRVYPDAPLSWGACLTLLARAFYPGEPAAHPVSGDAHWALPAYRAALALDVLEQADFLPVSPSGLDAPISRRDAAVLLDRALRRAAGLSPVLSPGGPVPTDWNALPEPYRPSVLQCYARGVVDGYEDGRFAGTDTVTRAAAAALFVRALALTGGEEAPRPPAETPPASAVPGGLLSLGDNSAKRVLLYGDAARSRFADQAEAEAHMAVVAVPVWSLDAQSGVKSSATLSLRVHEALAEEVLAIFTEIYNDPEQFPIRDLGGYDWRGDAASGEHNRGTAIDINFMSNYQIYAGGAVGAGDHWTPGEDPWSIPEDGSVVRSFNAHGWSWGGNSWPTNKDYMHFSYLGV